MSKEEADEVFEKWKPEFLGDSTKIRRALSTEKPNRTVIIKEVPVDVTDEMIQSCLDTQFADAKPTRFINRDSTKLGTVKIVPKSGNDLGKALHQGFFIDSIYYKTTPSVQNGIQIVRIRFAANFPPSSRFMSVLKLIVLNTFSRQDTACLIIHYEF